MSDTPINFDEVRRAREEARKLERSGGGGHYGGMPPDDLRERLAKVEAGLVTLASAIEKLVDRIDKLSDKMNGLTERVSAIEGQLRHIPTVTTIVLGQVLAAAAVAGIIISAFSYGMTSAKVTAGATNRDLSVGGAPLEPPKQGGLGQK